MLTMEGGGPEIENLVFSDIPNNSTNKEGENKQELKNVSEAAEVSGEADKGNGVISNFIHAFVSSRGKEDQEDEVAEEVSKRDALDEEIKEEREGGLLNHLISMVTPNQDNNTETEDGKKDSSSEAESNKNGLAIEDKDGGGGVIHNLISNILHPKNGENDKIGEDGQVIEDGGGKDVAGGGESHHLPMNDEDERGTAPEIEEASMLIHSIVHD